MRPIRHPEQAALAVYLIFVTIFTVVAAVLFWLFTWLAAAWGLGPALARPIPALLFLVLVFGPAFALAFWQAGRPPWRRPAPP